MKKIIALILALCVVFSLAIPALADSSEPTKLKTCIAKDIGTFNIFKTGSGVDLIVLRTLIGEPLLNLTNDFSFEGRVAESYSVNEDQTVYTFNLRPGLKWHDGKDVTVDDVVYSLNLARTGSLTSEFDGYIQSIETPDDHTVVVTLNAPYSSFLYSLYCFTSVVPNGAFEEGSTFEEHPIGTGPWMFDSYTPGDNLVLKANPDYYYGKPGYDYLEMRIMTDDSAIAIALETGELDIASISANNYGLLQYNENLEFAKVDQCQLFFLGFETTHAPFDDKNVRLAISYAIDKEGLNLVINEGACNVANGMSSPSVYGYNEDIEGYPYNLEKAKQCLAEAGYENGNGFPKFTITVIDSRKKIAEFIQANLKELGLDCNIQTMEANAFLEAEKNHELDTFITAIAPGCYAINNSLILTSGSTYNFFSFASDRVDELYGIAAVSTNEEEVLACYHEIDEIVQDAVPFTPLYWGVVIWAHRNDVNIDKALNYTCSDDVLPFGFVYPKN